MNKRIKHGEKGTRLYCVWRHMKERCLYKSSGAYKYYGGRGIKVCKEWSDSYIAFRDWAMENGYDPNAEFGKCTLDRIDCNGDYEPSNCRWVDAKTQNNNRRNNRRLTLNGETHDMTEWAEITGLLDCTISRRLKKGWSLEDALTVPLKRKERGTLDAMIAFMETREWFTRQELADATGVKGVDRFLVRLQEEGCVFEKKWENGSTHSGWRGRIRLYKLVRVGDEERDQTRIRRV